MSRIFISHSSKDNAHALAMAEWLDQNGWPKGETFLDIDPVGGLVAGAKWQEALKAAAGRCEAVVFLVSRAWLDSHWCRSEFLLAKNMGKKIFGVLIDDTTIPVLAREFPELTHEQAVTLSAPGEMVSFQVTPPQAHEPVEIAFSVRALMSLKTGLERAGLDARSFTFDPTREIFRGLRALEEEDAAIFFGRDGKIAEALDSLRAMTAKDDARLFVILGASGAGKSSFLRAGLLPRMARDDRRWLRLPPLRPERAALTGDQGLYAVLERAFARLKTPRARATLAEQITEGGLVPVVEELRGLARVRLLDPDAAAPVAVLPIDQGEELFQPDESGEAAKLLQALKPVLEAGGFALVLAMRSDGFARLQADPVLGALKAQIFSLPPLPKGAYQQVIEGPVKRLQAAKGEAALRLDPQLTEALLQDVGGGEAADALPLLAFVLERLFRSHGAGGALTRENYTKTGGLQGAIEAAATQALADPASGPYPIPVVQAEREALLRRVFIPHLAQIDGETRSPRRRVAEWDSLSADERNMAERLVAVRLLVKHQDDAASGVKLEPAHEALLRQWPRLAGWLKDEEEALIQLDGVLRAAEDWDTNARRDDYLSHKGGRLTDAEALRARPDFARLMAGTPGDYLAAAREAVAADQAREREQIEREKAAVEAAKAANEKAQAAIANELRAAEEAKAANEKAQSAIASELQAAEEAKAANEKAQAAIANELRAAEEAKAANEKAQSAIASELQAAEEAKAANEKAAAAVARNRRRLRIFAGVVAFAMAVVTLAGVLAFWQARTNAENLGKSFAELSDRAFKDHRYDEAMRWGLAGVTTLGAGELLGPNDNIAEVRSSAASWRLPLRRTLRGHTNTVEDARYSPDGNTIVTVSNDKTVKVWDAITGMEVASLMGHFDGRSSAKFSPDGKTIVTVSFGDTASAITTAILWDAKTGRQIATLKGDANTAEFSPDGKTLVTLSWDDTDKLWDTRTGRELATLKGHANGVNSVQFSPDGTRIVTASVDKTAKLWNAKTGVEISTLKGHAGKVNSAEFSPDGKTIVTASDDSTARLWDAASGAEIATLKAQENGGFRDAKFSPDSKRIVTQEVEIFRLWDAKTHREIAVLKGHKSGVTNAEFSPDGTRLVTAAQGEDTGASPSVKLWDAQTGEEIATFESQYGVTEPQFSPDGTKIVTSSDGPIAQLWDAKTGHQLEILRGHKGPVTSAGFSPDGTRIVSASHDMTAKIWNANTPGEIATLNGHSETVKSAEFSPDGKTIVTASDDNTAKLWDVKTGKNTATLKGHADNVSSAQFSPDGKTIVTVSEDNTAKLWDAMTHTEIAPLKGNSYEVSIAKFSPDSKKVLTGSEDNSAKFWDARTGREIATLKGHAFDAEISPDWNIIVTFPDYDTVQLWDTKTGAEIATLQGHAEDVASAKFSPDSKTIVTASVDGITKLWDIKTGTEIATLKGHAGRVNSIEFSPDGKTILTASWDDTAKIWDAKSGTEIATLRGHTDDIHDAQYSPDGKIVVTTVLNDDIGDVAANKLWDVGTGQEIASLFGHDYSVNMFHFSPDGSKIVTASNFSAAKIWDVSFFTRPRTERIRLACERLKEAGVAQFTDEEMAQPIMAGRGRDPCNREGLLSWSWWAKAVGL